MGKPFRIHEPAPPAKKDQGAAAPPPGKQVARSRDTGDPLPGADKDTPAHSPTIPWPPPQADPRPPMKLK